MEPKMKMLVRLLAQEVKTCDKTRHLSEGNMNLHMLYKSE